MAESAVNQPHPDDQVERGTPFDPNGVGAGLDAEFDAAMGESEFHEEDADALGTEDIEPEPEAWAPVPGESWEPDHHYDNPPQPDDPAPEPTYDDVHGENAPKQEDLDRSYVVLQQVTMTRDVLQRMLKHVEDGGSPVTVLAPLGTYENRNKAGAMRDAYSDHKDAMPKPAYLVAVTERSVKVHKVAPKQPVEPSLEITDEF